MTAGSSTPDHRRWPRRVTGGILRCLAGIGALAAAWIAATLALLGAWWGAGLAAVAAAAVLPWPGKLGWRRPWLVRPAVLATVVLVGLSAYGWFVAELQRGFDGVAGRLRTTGVDSASLRDEVATAAVGLTMAGLAAPVFPEVAREQLLLYVPGPAVRTWSSDFAMASPQVRRVVNEYRHAVQAADRDSIRLPQRLVHFRFERTPRVALALNPARISATGRRRDDGWLLDLAAEVAVKYSATARVPVPVGLGQTVVIPELVFWHLQERGWLHPYRARWVWEVRARHDPG
jgi:hypothetical protein